jgi:hypothetical protein
MDATIGAAIASGDEMEGGVEAREIERRDDDE